MLQQVTKEEVRQALENFFEGSPEEQKIVGADIQLRTLTRGCPIRPNGNRSVGLITINEESIGRIVPFSEDKVLTRNTLNGQLGYDIDTNGIRLWE